MENRLKELIESLIFVSSEPLSTERIKIVLEEFSEEEIEQVLQKLVASYASDETGIEITRSAGSYLFSTKPEFDPWIRRLLRIERKNKLCPKCKVFMAKHKERWTCGTCHYTEFIKQEK